MKWSICSSELRIKYQPLVYGKKKKKSLDEELRNESVLCLEKNIYIQLAVRESNFSYFLTMEQTPSSGPCSAPANAAEIGARS